MIFLENMFYFITEFYKIIGHKDVDSCWDLSNVF